MSIYTWIDILRSVLFVVSSAALVLALTDTAGHDGVRLFLLVASVVGWLCAFGWPDVIPRKRKRSGR